MDKHAVEPAASVLFAVPVAAAAAAFFLSFFLRNDCARVRKGTTWRIAHLR